MEMIEKASSCERSVVELMEASLRRKERELRSLPEGVDRRLLKVEITILEIELDEVRREFRSATV